MRKHWLLFSQAVTVALAGYFVVLTLKPQWLDGATHIEATLPPPTVMSAPAALPRASAVDTGYSSAADRAAPAVVSVTASKVAQPNPHRDDPRFRFFFGDRPPQSQLGLGSGVIVAPEGYLLTNNHVIEGADDIEIQLADGREASARLIGTDPETDLAVLKIELDRLPVLRFGDVRAMRVGDIVLAIGNPFNVGQTVTSGIVSALGRNRLGLSTFENFIQTDAAINPGNSGGALVDVNGNLIGINTAIFSRSGGSMGIGFAIPVDTARQVMESLIRDGRVTRGWIGVEPRDLTPAFIESFHLPVKDGVLIAGVLSGGPASKGGMKPGDVVQRIGDKSIADTATLLAEVSALAPNAETVVAVQRGAQTIDLKIRVGERPPARPER